MNRLILFIVVGIVADCCFSSDILAFLPSNAQSHYGAFEPLLRELAVRGHNLTVLSPFAMKNAPSTYNHIQVEKDDRVMSKC